MISGLTLEGTGFEGLEFAYSVNGAQWTAADSLAGSAAAKYVRLYNDTGSAVTCDLQKLGVTVESTKADPSFLETNLTNGLKEGAWTNVFDGEEGTYAWTNEGQAVGDHITFDLGATISLYDVTVVTADGNPRLYNAEIQISANKTDWQTIATVVNDNSVFEVPYRYVRANAEGATARYLRIYFTGDTGYYCKLHEIFLNTTVESSADTDVITASFGSEIGNAIDGNLSTLFTGTATTADSIEYKFTESTNLQAISILQDPGSISDAIVSILGDSGYEVIGRLDESAKKFQLDSAENVYGLKLTFEKETDISLYEIYLDADKSASDDIGEYVDPIIVETKEDLTEPTNLATGKTVTVSGTSDGNKDNVNDGDTSTKWDSDFIKGSGAKENSWIYMDLGAEQTSIFDEMTIHYFNKIYPTLMYIQVSNDATTWHDISELTRTHNGQTHPVVTEGYDTPYAARYIRLFFEELNSAAAGNGVGITEWSVTGIALSDVSLTSAVQPEGIHKDVDTALTEADLPKFIRTVLTHKVAGDLEVLVPVEWDLSSYDSSSNGVCQIVGTLDLPASVRASDNTVTMTVTVGTGESHEHSYTPAVTAPTCTEGGYTTYTCSCGDVYTADATPALGHDWHGTACSRCDAVRVNPFEDVPEDSYYIDPVLWAVEKGITNGMDATHFGPTAACNRAQVVTFLWRASGSPEPTTGSNPFTDVNVGDFYYKAVLWAVEKGITNGIDATHFGPNTTCNRGQVVTFLYRAQGSPDVTGVNNPFTDVNVGSYYGSAVLWALQNGITTGSTATTFEPGAVCNRAQVVTFLYRSEIQ